MKYTIHIRAPKPTGNHYNAKTLCGQRLHSTATTCDPGSKVRIDMTDKANTGWWGFLDKQNTTKRMHTIHSITSNEADIMDDIYDGKMRKGDLWVPQPSGPCAIRVREMEWCEDCFEHGMRTLKMLAKTEL